MLVRSLSHWNSKEVPKPQFTLPLLLLRAQLPTGVPGPACGPWPQHPGPRPALLIPERRDSLNQHPVTDDTQQEGLVTMGHHPIDASQQSSTSRLPQTHSTDKEPEVRRRDTICQMTGPLRQDLKVRSSESRPRPLPTLPLEEKVSYTELLTKGVSLPSSGE